MRAASAWLTRCGVLISYERFKLVLDALGRTSGRSKHTASCPTLSPWERRAHVSVAHWQPIGNGFPLAAVVTTPEIAKKFSNGME